jgi:hypothetical protein
MSQMRASPRITWPACVVAHPPGSPNASRLEERNEAKLNDRKPMPATTPTNQRKATTKPTGRFSERVSHT